MRKVVKPLSIVILAVTVIEKTMTIDGIVLKGVADDEMMIVSDIDDAFPLPLTLILADLTLI